ncbi:hypothetical protein ACS5PK_13165 [Roseateles sp. DB2]|uniref:hypothetical protein n=1 Tax=Roseateles sp. DB2 TaxID=3453717 RepID=UPI003EEF23B6
MTPSIPSCQPRPQQASQLSTLLSLLLLHAGMASAQPTLRDPMQMPAALRPAAAAGGSSPAAALPQSAQVLIADGKAYALIGSRRYAQGSRIGSGAEALTVERVTEHGVWLRSRNGLHALPMVSGVSKKPSPESGSPDKSQEKRDRP